MLLMLASFVQLINTKKKWIYPQHQARKGIIVVFQSVHQFFFNEISNYCLTFIFHFFPPFTCSCSCSTKPLERSHGVGWIVLLRSFCLFLHLILHTRYIYPFALFILYRTTSPPTPRILLYLYIVLPVLLFAIGNLFHHIFTLLSVILWLVTFPIFNFLAYFQHLNLLLIF